MDDLSKRISTAFPCQDSALAGEAGLRSLCLPNAVLRRAKQTPDEFICRIKRQLPADAAVVDYDGLVVRTNDSSQPGIPRDEFFIVFMSRQWEPLPDGSSLPLTRIEFN